MGRTVNKLYGRYYKYAGIMMITSTLKHGMARSTGEQTDLCINKSQIHIQTANIVHTINTNFNS